MIFFLNIAYNNRKQFFAHLPYICGVQMSIFFFFPNPRNLPVESMHLEIIAWVHTKTHNFFFFSVFFFYLLKRLFRIIMVGHCKQNHLAPVKNKWRKAIVKGMFRIAFCFPRDQFLTWFSKNHLYKGLESVW